MSLANVDSGIHRPPKQAAADHVIELLLVKLPDIKRGFVLLTQRWAIERDFGWMSRLARDQERMAERLRSFQLVASIMLMIT